MQLLPPRRSFEKKMVRRIYISLAIFFFGEIPPPSLKHLIHPQGALIFFKKVVKKITPFSFLKTPVTGVILNRLSSYHLHMDTSLVDKNSPQHSLLMGCSLGFDDCVPFQIKRNSWLGNAIISS